MGAFKSDGEELFASDSGVLRIGHFGPPELLVVPRKLDDPGRKRKLWQSVARRVHGVLTLDGRDWDMQLTGLFPWPGYGLRIEGVLARRTMTEWLGSTARGARTDQVLLYQRGEEEKLSNYLKRLVGDEEERERCAIGGGEEDIVFPAPSGCLVRPGDMSNQGFLDLISDTIAARDSRMFGWRTLPDKRSWVAFVVARDPVKMEGKHWEVVLERGFGGQGQGGGELPVRLSRRRPKGGRYRGLKDVMQGLFGNVYPDSNVFGGDGVETPTAPGWVRFEDRTCFASDILLEFDEEHDGTANITDVLVDLRSGPAPRASNGTVALIANGTVAGWNSGGYMLMLTQPEEGDWQVVGTAPGFKEGELGARCVMPGLFGKEGAEGGIYLQPAEGDQRAVILIQGGVPVSPGSIARQQTDLGDKDIVIRSGGARMILDDESVHVDVMKRFDVSRK